MEEHDLLKTISFEAAISAVEMYGLILLTLDGNILSWNAGATKLLGYKASETIDQNFEIIFTPEDRGNRVAEKEMAKAIANGHAFDDRWHVRKDQSQIWVNGGLCLLRSESGQSLGFVKIIRDQTEKKRDQDNRKRFTDIYETILGTTDDFAYIFDPKGRFLYANAPLLKVWAKTLDQVVGKTCHDLGYPIWHADMHMREIEEIVRTRKPIRGEVPFTGDSGISGIYDYIFKPVLGTTGEVTVIVGTTRDITDRKRAEEKLTQTQIELSDRAFQLESALKAKSDSEERYRFLADTVPQIVWTATPDGKPDYYNNRWFEFAGIDPENGERPTWFDFIHPDDVSVALRAWHEALTNGTRYQAECRLHRGTDSVYRWHLVRAFPMKEDGIAIQQWVGTCTDIDDQVRANEVLESTVADRTAKLQTVIGELESFSYSISHDLRAPLRAMMGFASVLREEYAPQLDAEANRYLERISSASQRMDELIKDVLSYSQMSRSELVLQPIEPGKLISDIVGTYPHLAPTEITITVQPALPAILANPAALTQCIANLLGNAVKFVAPGVKPKVEISYDTENGFVRLRFSDNGIGIAAENLSSVFEIFKRVTFDREGTGIGLSIVKKAVERMGGSIELESEVGRGSIFTLKLRAA